MKYADKTVKKNKYEIGDLVKVHDLYIGKIGFIAGYRGEKYGGWHYKVRGPHGEYLTWAEKSLRKVPVRERHD